MKPHLVDWNALGHPKIQTLLNAMQNKDGREYHEAFDTLRQILIPDAVVEVGHWIDAAQVIQEDLPRIVTPVLIERLEHEGRTQNKVGLLEMLYLLATYWMIRGKFNRIEYEQWAYQIIEVIQKGLPIYKKLLSDTDPHVQARAQELVTILDKAS